MTKAASSPDDNGGRCEVCDRPETKFQTQTTYPVMLGGGLGPGTMWVCSECRVKLEERDKAKQAEGIPTGDIQATPPKLTPLDRLLNAARAVVFAPNATIMYGGGRCYVVPTGVMNQLMTTIEEIEAGT